MVWGAVIGAGASLFGASRARSDARRNYKRQVKAQKNKFVDLRAAAELGGFNPLTALQATGGAGFGTAPLDGGNALASAEILTNAVQTVAEAFTNRQTVETAQQSAMLDAKRAELQSLGAEVAGMPRPGQMTAASTFPAGNVRQTPVAPAPAQRQALTGLGVTGERLRGLPAIDDAEGIDPQVTVFNEGGLLQSNTIRNPDGTLTEVTTIRGEDVGEIFSNASRYGLALAGRNPNTYESGPLLGTALPENIDGYVPPLFSIRRLGDAELVRHRPTVNPRRIALPFRQTLPSRW